jgi:hypothetical protein
MWQDINKFINKLIRKNKAGVYIIRDEYTKRLTLVNNGEKIPLVDDNGKLLHFTHADINFERVNRLENSWNAEKLQAPYGFYVDPFRNGVALVSWTLYPDGRYFEDEDGFGAENCNETTIYGFMDTRANVLISFQDMNNDEKERLREEAEEDLKIKLQK